MPTRGPLERDTDLDVNPFISRRIPAFDPDDPFHGEW